MCSTLRLLLSRSEPKFVPGSQKPQKFEKDAYPSRIHHVSITAHEEPSSNNPWIDRWPARPIVVVNARTNVYGR
jgi:hypothetical protein